jgi:pilus assembly protein Flp/PilA
MDEHVISRSVAPPSREGAIEITRWDDAITPRIERGLARTDFSYPLEGRTMLGYVRKAMARARTTAEKGASAVEYGLMVAAIAALIVGTVFALGGFVKASFDKTCSALSASQPTCTSSAG